MWPFSTIRELREWRVADKMRIQELEEALRQSLARETGNRFITVAKDFDSVAVDKLALATFDQVVDKYEGILHRSILDALQRLSCEQDLLHKRRGPIGRVSVAFERTQAYYQMVIHIPDYHHTVKIHRSVFDD